MRKSLLPAVLLLFIVQTAWSQPDITYFTPTTGCEGTLVTIGGSSLGNIVSVTFGGVNAASFAIINATTVTALVGPGASGAVKVTKASGDADSLNGFTHFTPAWYPDADHDGFGDSASPVTMCIQPSGYITDNRDCNDQDPSVNINGIEIPNGQDDNCNGWIDEEPPVIASFSPLSGPAGTEVIISGTSFDFSASDLTVYFGATRATITGANASQVTVIVPAGATYKPISVTNAYGLTGWSVNPFVVTTPGNCAIEPGRYSEPQLLENAVPGIAADFNGDGKTDLAGIHDWDNPSVIQNTTEGDVVSFGSPVFLNSVLQSNLLGVATDIDGDGQLDLLMEHHDSWWDISSIYLYKNTSTINNVSFQGYGYVNYLIYPDEAHNLLETGDIDADGRPDLLTRGGNMSALYVSRNISWNGAFGLDWPSDLLWNEGYYVNAAVLSDFDQDFLPDIVCAGVNENPGTTGILIFKNSSTTGHIAFQPFQLIPNFMGMDMLASDLDLDGIPDLVLSGDSILVFRNSGIAGIISFEVPFIINGMVVNPGVSDLNGDGKPDLFGEANGQLTVWENQSSPGLLAFTEKPGISVFGAYSIIDLNNDSKYDFVGYGNYLLNQCTPAVCSAVTSTSVTDLTASSARLNWDGVPEAEGYKVRYKPSGTSQWTIKTTTSGYKQINELLSGTKYEWQVKTYCSIAPNIMSAWSQKQFFTTLPLKLSAETTSVFDIYPNPLETSASVSFSVATGSRVQLELFDLTGKCLGSVLDAYLTAGQHTVELNVMELNEGLYFLQLRAQEGTRLQRVVIER